MKAYRSVVKDYATDSFIEKKSEFISYVKRIDSEEDAKNFVAEIKSKHSDATHNCYAYVVRGTEIARFSDDGEPSGTAGMPILDVIKREGLSGVCIVVTRYFGGTLLGTGGLVRAYSDALKAGLEASELSELLPGVVARAELGYDLISKVKYTARQSGIYITDEQYGEGCTMTFLMERDGVSAFSEKLSAMSLGKCSLLEPREVLYYDRERPKVYKLI